MTKGGGPKGGLLDFYFKFYSLERDISKIL
jgi:hypothetical protein